MHEPTSPRPADVDNEWLFGRHGRPLFAFAHQDDEVACAGLLHRCCGDGQRGTFLWWTNGDGLAPMAQMDPPGYAAVRLNEAAASLRALGADPAHKVDLESSEIENYRRFTHVAAGGAARDDALAYFRSEARRVEVAVHEAEPDRVFLLAFQGGQPEHDLTHAFVTRAVRHLRRKTGRAIPIVQFPAYEYTVLNPMRFKPWYKGDRRREALSDAEMAAKKASLDAYVSQAQLFRQFRRVIGALGVLSALRGKPFNAEAFLAVEEFGVVDPDLDLTRSTHRLERLNYMGDDFQGTPIRFDTMIKPIIEALLAD